ncbi:MAG: response regulator [Pseudomonadota bacterium]|nr:response regulator [Pseudomonadota bacterium]
MSSKALSWSLPDGIDVLLLSWEKTSSGDTTVSTGVSADGVLSQLILLDVIMPGMNGPETLKKLREIPAKAHTPVIFMTATVQTTEIREYMSLGAIDVISRPFDPMTLAARISSLWDSHCGR